MSERRNSRLEALIGGGGDHPFTESFLTATIKNQEAA